MELMYLLHRALKTKCIEMATDTYGDVIVLHWSHRVKLQMHNNPSSIQVVITQVLVSVTLRESFTEANTLVAEVIFPYIY